MKRVLVLATLLMLATTAAATDFASHSVIIPVAGRTPGAFGSEWRTDLVITNAARTGQPVPITIVFSRNDGAQQVVGATLNPRGSMVLEDVIGDAFGQTNAMGMLRVGTVSPEAKITARARIYNVGTATGEYGQIVHGMPLGKLSRDAYLSGLSGVGGVRTNVGIANPAERDTEVWLSLFDENGNFRGGFSTVISKGTVRQFNDIFSYFQTGPLDSATLQIISADGVYPYATLVRADSGDADFVTATAVEIDESEAVVMPACASPAPLRLSPLPSDGWIVMFRPGTNAVQKTNALAAQHGFTPNFVFEYGFQGFSAELSHAVIALLRCDADVRVVQQNEIVPVP